MKRTFERLAFMLLGALLVCGAYLVGKSETRADARSAEFEDVYIRGALYIKDRILIGDTNANPANSIMMSTDGESPRIGLEYEFNPDDGTSTGSIMMGMT